MALAAKRFDLWEGSLADDAPDDLDELGRHLVASVNKLGAFDQLRIVGGQSAVGVFKLPRYVPTAETSPYSGLVFEVGDGQVIASDPVGVAFGCGASNAEAVAEWEERAREHLADLRENEHRLHPRMAVQLEYLRRLFG